MIDYAKIDYVAATHHARYVTFVNMNGLTCQECSGDGGEVEPIDEYGGPFHHCGWCEGTGLVTRWERGRWLQYRKSIKPAAISGKSGETATRPS